ncbi:MAG: hypothetical protein ACI8RZ_005513 [Myxococcota bacterium]
MRSLLIVGLPRSMTSLVYTQAVAALGLRQPMWTSAGEILNVERFGMAAGMAGNGRRYTLPTQPYATEQIHDWLSQCVPREGYAFKDVVQPFALSSWPDVRKLAVLYIRRSPAAVAWLMRRSGWLYPAQVGEGQGDAALLHGLMRAQAALETIAEVTVSFSDLLESEEALINTLMTLYPDVSLRPIRYINAGFVLRRQQLEDERTHPSWQALQACTAL